MSESVKYDINSLKKNLRKIRNAFSNREPILRFRGFEAPREKSERAPPEKEIVVVKEPQGTRVDTLNNQNKSGVLYGGSHSASDIQFTQKFRERYRKATEPKQPQEEAQAQQQENPDVIDLILHKVKERRETSIFSSIKKIANAHAKRGEIEVKKVEKQVESETKPQAKKKIYVHW